MGFNLRSGNGPLKFKQMGSSPAKGIFGEKIDLVQEKEDPINTITKKATEGASEKITNKTPNPNVKDKEKVRVMTKKELNMKQDGKLGTVFSRTAKKIGKGVKHALSKKVASVKQNISDKKAVKAKAKVAADTPEKRLALRKERSTKIADGLEYLFLDGKRPDRLAAKRKAKAEKDAAKKAKLEPTPNAQNEHTEFKEGEKGLTNEMKGAWLEKQTVKRKAKGDAKYGYWDAEGKYIPPTKKTKK